MKQNEKLLSLLQEMLNESFLLQPHPSISRREEKKPRTRLPAAKTPGYDPCKLPDFTTLLMMQAMLPQVST